MDDQITYRQQVSFCGKPNCRKCRDGIGHGPYWYAYRLNADGRKQRVYIGKTLPPEAANQSDRQNVGQGDREGRPYPTTESPTVPVQGTGDPRGRPGSEIDTLDRLLAADPTNEDILQRLALALAQAKRRGEALRACQRFFATLQSLHLTPSQQIQSLYQSIQHGDNINRPSEEDLTADRVSIGRSNQSPLVGRDKERETLRQMLLLTEQALTSNSNPDQQQKKSLVASAIALEKPRTQCITLMGESGIGKTRLAEEAARDALRNGWAVVWSHAYAQESGIPYRMWSEALRGLLEQGVWRPDEMIAEQQTLSQVYKPLKTLLPELHEWWPEHAGRDVSGPYNHNPLSPEQEQVRLREAVYALLTTISATTPLLIVLDDVQWADGSSSELLGYLARRLPGHPIALLATCRETELAANAMLHSLLSHMQREHAVEYLRVEPLSDTQIAALVAHLPGSFVRHIQTQAAGNPFFAEELAYTLGAGQDAPGIRHAQSDEALALPTTITAVLNQRMQRLSLACQQLLSRAAVLGGSFGYPLISAMETGVSAAYEDDMLDLLDEALRSGVLTEEGTGSRITYRFWHPLLASHLYNALSATRRARMHRRAADVLQQAYAGREDEQAAAITGHLLKGGADAAQIARFAELAANYAYALSAYPEAERYYRLVVQYTETSVHSRGGTPGTLRSPSGKESLPFLLERLAECVRIQGKFQEARRLFERVLDVRNQQANSLPAVLDAQEAQVQALLWGEIGWTWRYTGDNLRAWQCCERGEQVLRAAGITSGPAPARLRFQQGSLRWQEGQYEEAYRIVGEALQLFEGMQPQPAVDAAHLTRIRRTLLGDPVDLGRAEALLGAIANTIGQREEALRHMHTALALYEQYDRQREIAHVCCNIGFVHLKLARYAQARPFLQRSFTLAERIGDAPLTSVVLHNLGELAVSSGEGGSEEAESYFRSSITLAEQINDREYLSLWNADLASVLLERGKLDDAALCVGRALRTARGMRNIPCLTYSLLALGNLRIAQARTSGDPRCLKRASTTLHRALSLPAQDTDTHAKIQLALAQIAQLSNNPPNCSSQRP